MHDDPIWKANDESLCASSNWIPIQFRQRDDCPSMWSRPLFMAENPTSPVRFDPHHN